MTESKIDYKELKDKYGSLVTEVECAARKAGGQAPTVCLATKTQPVDALEALKGAGAVLFGENRAQELIAKYPQIGGVKWHFIGRLQTNKVKYIIDKVELIHSLDRLSLAHEINSQAEKRGVVMPVLIEVKLADEAEKGGVKEDELFAFAETVAGLKSVSVVGLMTVMPIVSVPFNPYEKMAVLFDRFKGSFGGIKYLSMGMSQDYLTAIQYGSNIIRVGRAVFGERGKGKDENSEDESGKI